ncbi:MAG: AAA family ATPase, partial [Verrucomicrobiales bacterium]
METTTQIDVPSATQTLRIFISSPGDVEAERIKARQVVAQLQTHYGPAVSLIPVLWEELPLTFNMAFQEGIDVILSDEKGIDIAVFILWSRLGTKTSVGGKIYRSGTERELDLMLSAYQASKGQRPEILFYQRVDDEGFASVLAEPTNKGRADDLISQHQLAKSFVKEQFWDEQRGNIRAYFNFQKPVDFAGRLKVHLQGLIDRRLEARGLGREAHWTDLPYRGLEVFNVEHADIFFGREKEIADLESRLREREREEPLCAFVAVIGASGSGKSSLVRAGLRANLTRFNLDESISEWRSLVMVPGLAEGRLIEHLVEALTQAEALPELKKGGLSLNELAENLAKSPQATIHGTIAPLLKRAKGKAAPKLLVVIDQFEELFTDKRIGTERQSVKFSCPHCGQHISAGEEYFDHAANCPKCGGSLSVPSLRDQFLLILEALAQSGFCWVVVTMRSDFFPIAQKSEIFLRLKGDSGQLDVLPPGTEALRRIITEPAWMAGVKFETRAREQGGQSVVDKILGDARDQADMLPLLSDLLLELYQHRNAENVITFAAYEALGDENKTGLEGALSKRAEKEFGELTREQQATLPEILHALVTVEGDADVRRRASLAALRDTPEKDALVDAFIQARLLTADGPTVSIAHEALLRKWDRIADWVRANRQYLRIRSRVEQAMRRWETQGNDSSLRLPDGLDLEEGNSLLRDSPHLLAGSEYDGVRDYIQRSRNHHDARARKARAVRRVVTFFLSFLAIGATAGAVFGWWQTRQATAERIVAESRLADSLVAQGDALIPAGRIVTAKQRFRESADLLVKLHLNPFPATIGLWEAEREQAAPTHTFDVPPSPQTVAVFPDGSMAIAGHGDGSIRIWDINTGKTFRSFGRHSGATSCLAVAPDGKTALSGSNEIILWDIKTGKEIRRFGNKTGAVNALAYTPDGRFAIAGSRDGSVRLWDVSTGSHVREFKHFIEMEGGVRFGGAFIHGVAISPNGRFALSASGAMGDNALKLWAVETGKELHTLVGHGSVGGRNAVLSVAFSPDSKSAISS